MKTVAESFVKYGLVMVDGVEASAEATERLCRRVAPIHDTFFGAFWVFSNKAQEKGVRSLVETAMHHSNSS